MKALLLLLLGLAVVFPSPGSPNHETAAASDENLHTRQFHVGTEVFVRNLRQLAPPKAGESNQELLVRFFKAKHVEIKKPAALSLDEKKGLLLVRTTLVDLDKIEELIGQILSKK